MIQLVVSKYVARHFSTPKILCHFERLFSKLWPYDGQSMVTRSPFSRSLSGVMTNHRFNLLGTNIIFRALLHVSKIYPVDLFRLMLLRGWPVVMNHRFLLRRYVSEPHIPTPSTSRLTFLYRCIGHIMSPNSGLRGCLLRRQATAEDI